MSISPIHPGHGTSAPGKWPTLIKWGVLAVIVLCCLIEFCRVQAANYELIIPIQTATPETAQIYYADGGDFREENSSTALLTPGSKQALVGFPLRGPTVARLRFDPAMSANAITIGVPRLRCRAYHYLGRYAPTRYVCDLEDIAAGQQIRQIIREGDLLRIVPEAGATDPACIIRLKQSLALDYDPAAFWALLSSLAVAVGLMGALLRFGVARLFSLIRPFTTELLASPDRAAAPTPKWEKYSLLIVFLASTLVQVNAIAHDGAMGQDFKYNFNFSRLIVEHPEQPLPYAPTNPHGFHLLNAGVLWLTGGVHSEAMCGLLNAAINLVALWIFYLLARRFILRPVWRVALLTLVGFLPLRLIHTVVIAADALTLLPMFALVWLLIRLTDAAAGPSKRRVLAISVSALLTISLTIKYTFLSALIAVALTVLQLVRRQRASWREGVLLGALALFMPFAALVIGRLQHPQFTNDLYLSGGGSGTMSYGDLVAFKKADLHIFDAPPWDEPLDPAKRARFNGTTLDPGQPYELLTSHRHGFLALNHLLIFTDAVNIFQYDPTDAYFGQRSARNQRLMALATKTSVPITVLCMVCVGVLTVGSGLHGWLQPATSRVDVEATLLLALGWFCNIVVLLPLVNVDAYLAGLWDPRQTMAAMLLFLLLTAFLLDRLLKGKAGEIAGWTALVYVIGQSVLDVSFLWPWGKM